MFFQRTKDKYKNRTFKEGELIEINYHNYPQKLLKKELYNSDKNTI